LHLALGGALLGATTLSYADEQPAFQKNSPDILLGPLFNDVQSAKLFPDQKTFADAVPKSDPLMILADYRMQHTQSSFDLRHFVEMNFTLPAEGESMFRPQDKVYASILTISGPY
jgi:alpha,alpha-trehalase